MESESRRGRRRRMTEKVARRRRDLRRADEVRLEAIVNRVSWGGICSRYQDRLGYWDTHRPHSCRCSSRQHGRPRVNRGMCNFGRRDRVYRWRGQVRELNRLLARGYDPEGDGMAVLSDARSVEKTGLWS